jgi:hypothetical protein
MPYKSGFYSRNRHIRLRIQGPKTGAPASISATFNRCVVQSDSVVGVRKDLLYCTVLYCTVQYCTVLYCTVLYCTVFVVLYNRDDDTETTVLICLSQLASYHVSTHVQSVSSTGRYSPYVPHASAKRIHQASWIFPDHSKSFVTKKKLEHKKQIQP